VTFAAPGLGCGVALVVDGRVLLVQRLTEPEAGAWGLPGGKGDLYETAADAARREVMEELGIAVTLDRLLCFVDQIDRAAGTHWGAPVYLATRHNGEPRVMEPGKHGGCGWFALDALPETLTTPTLCALQALRGIPV
jgi:ADP-ribose pyrophosphatase YjhB (NUDIX family)